MRIALLIGVLTASVMLAGCGSERSGQEALISFESGPTGVPQNLRVERIRDGEVWLEWDKPDRGSVEVYIVYRAKADAEPAALDTTYAANFQDKGLNYETEYTYFVTAISSSGHESLRSQVVDGRAFFCRDCSSGDHRHPSRKLYRQGTDFRFRQVEFALKSFNQDY